MNDKMKDAWEVYWESRIDEIYYYDAKDSFEAGWQACAEAMQQDHAGSSTQGANMTRDDIIRMAREAGFTVETDRIFTNQYSEDCECTDAVCRLAELVADVERRKHQAAHERLKAETSRLRQAITNIHDRILRGDSDWELMAMRDSALKGTS